MKQKRLRIKFKFQINAKTKKLAKFNEKLFKVDIKDSFFRKSCFIRIAVGKQALLDKFKGPQFMGPILSGNKIHIFPKLFILLKYVMIHILNTNQHHFFKKRLNLIPFTLYLKFCPIFEYLSSNVQDSSNLSWQPQFL